MSGICPVVRVVSWVPESQGKFVEVNESDFLAHPELYTPYDPEDGDAPPAIAPHLIAGAILDSEAALVQEEKQEHFPKPPESVLIPEPEPELHKGKGKKK